MSTGDEFVNLTLKRFLSQSRMEGNFFDYLKTISTELGGLMFPNGGIFTYPVTITPDFVGNDFDLTPDPIWAIDNEGHIFNVTTTLLKNITFEDILNHYYWIALHYIEIPSGVYPNPRTGVPEYDKFQESIGDRGAPTSVTDLGGSIQFNINSIVQSGIDHSGRSVMVWLVNPVTSVPGDAIETVVSAYSSPNNTITTTGTLGQGTVSTNPADYQVAVIGPVVNDAGVAGANPYSADYTIIGYINGQTGVDTSDQIDLSGGGGHTLQKAYDGAGSGVGRTITANNEAVQIVQGNTALADKDIFLASQRMRKDDATSQPTVPAPNILARDFEVAFDCMMRIMSHGSLLHRVNIMDVTASNFLNAEEDVSVSAPGATLTFDRGGIDLTLTGKNFQIWEDVDYVEIESSTSGNDGVYLVDAVASSSTLTLLNIDGSTPALVAEGPASGMKARLYRPLARIGYLYGTGFKMHGISDIGNDDGFVRNLMEITAPVNTPDNTLLAWFYRDDGSGGVDTQVQIQADGDIQTDGDISAGNVSATGTCSGNNVTSVTTIAAGGKITAGNAFEVTTGNAEIKSGDLTVTGDIQGVNLTATAAIGAVGNITGSSLLATVNVQANNDVQCGASADHKYASARSRKKIIYPEKFKSHSSTVTINVGGAIASNTIALVNNGGGAGGVISAMVDLPIGATITEVNVLCGSLDAAGDVDVYLQYSQHDFGGTPAPGPRSNHAGTPWSNTGTGTEVISSGTISRTITEGYGYNIFIEVGSTSSVIDIYGIEIQYEYTNISEASN